MGTEGAALFRHLLDGDDWFVEQRVTAIRNLAAGLDGERLSSGMFVPELDVTEGYAAWAATYDTMKNGLICAEEPLVASVTKDLNVGVALDAACGTGRHAEWLAAGGHETVGIDASSAMLDIARQRVPTAEFKLGDLTKLRFDDASFDFAICALALAHLEHPGPAIRELARVVRPGGRIVLTDAHPSFVLIQGQALFPSPRGLAYVRNYPHPHGVYLNAFRTHGLSVLDCREAPMEADFTTGMFAGAADAAAALWNGIPAILVWSLHKAG